MENFIRKTAAYLTAFAAVFAWGAFSSNADGETIRPTYNFKRILKQNSSYTADAPSTWVGNYERWNFGFPPGFEDTYFTRVGFDAFEGGSMNNREGPLVLDSGNVTISNFVVDDFSFIQYILQPSTEGYALNFKIGSTSEMQASGVNLQFFTNLRGSGGGHYTSGALVENCVDYYVKTDLTVQSTGTQRAAVSNQSSGVLHFDAANTIYSNLDGGEGNGLIFSTWRRINRYISAGNIELNSKILAPGQDVEFNFAGIGPDKVLPFAIIGGEGTNNFSRMIVSSQVRLAKQGGALAFDGTDLIIEGGGLVSYLYADQLPSGVNLTFRNPADTDNLAGTLELNGSSQTFGALSLSRTGAAPVIANFDFGDNTVMQIAAFDSMSTSASLSGTATQFVIKNYIPDQDHIYFKNKLTSEQQKMLKFDGYSGTAGAQDGGEYGWEYLPDIFDVTPASVYCRAGNSVSFTAETDLTPLQWRYSADGGSSWTDISGANDKTYSFVAKASENNYRYRCVAGPESKLSSVTSLYVLTEISITKQPSPVDANEGAMVSFEVQAKGDSISYQWQYSSDGGLTWTDISGATSNVYSAKSEIDMNGYSYRCVLTSPLGATVISSAASLSVGLAIEILSQPSSVTVMYEDPAAISCEVLNAETVVWQKSLNGGASWETATDGTASEEAGETGMVYTYTVQTTRAMAQTSQIYRCALSNARGTVYTSAATLTVITAPRIVMQPSDQKVSSSDTARFTVEVIAKKDVDITYHWVLRDANDSLTTWNWVRTFKKFTDTVSMNDDNISGFIDYNGKEVYCEITQNGTTIVTNTVYLYVQSVPQISEQPQNQYIEENGNAEFKVAAVGEPVLLYKWWLLRPGNTTWEAAGSVSDTLVLSNVSKAYTGYKYRCEVTNDLGKVTSSEATLYVGSAVRFTKQPVSQSVGLYASASFSVEATGDGTLTYQWEYSDDTSNWTELYGQTSPTLNFSEVPYSWNGRYFRCIVTDNVDYGGTIVSTGNSSSSALLTVASTPLILLQPESLSVVAEETAKFTVAVSGGRLKYKWYVSEDKGTTWSEVYKATSATCMVISERSMDGRLYYCVVSNDGGSVQTDTVKLTVSAPVIFTKHPSSFKCFDGETASFSAEAVTEDGAINYQWQISYNSGVTWENVSGVGNSAQTNALSIKVSAATMHNCYFRCSAKNYMGRQFYSNPTILYVDRLPSITSQPSAVSAYEGTTATFSASVSGTPPFTYQWRVSTDGGQTWTNIDGATESTYSVDVEKEMSGNQYMCVVGNGGGSIGTTPAVLTVPTMFQVSSYPSSAIVHVGTPAVFSVVVTGSEISYQWQKLENGKWVNIAGAVSDTLTVAGILTNDLTQYRCVISNGIQTQSLSAVSLRVYSAPTVTPAEFVGIEGNSYTVSVEKSYSGESYQWQISTDNGANWLDIAGATGKSHTVSPLATSMNGTQFRVWSILPADSTVSSTAKLEVYSQIAITAQPVQTQKVAAGGSASFSVTASGEGLSYQWQTLDITSGKWFDMSGASAKTATLAINPVTKDNNGISMHCVVSNGAVSKTSNPCVVYVLDSINIGVQPASNVVGFADESVKLSVTASGTDIVYQWQKYDSASGKWLDLSGANSSEYVISSATATDAGEYRCVVSNTGMSITSSVSKLDILATPVVTGNATTFAVGNPISLNVTSVSGAKYAWEYKKNGTSAWISVGSNSANYNIPSASAAMNGDRYRCTLTVLGKSAISNEYVVEVVAAVAITEHPQSAVVTGGEPLSLKVVAIGATSYQWQTLDYELGEWRNISSATSSVYIIPEVTADFHNKSFRCVVSSKAEDVTSNAAKITIGQYYQVTPASASVKAGETLTFLVGNAPDGASYQWQSMASDASAWTNIAGATSASYTIASATAADNNRKIRCRVSTSAGVGAASTVAEITIDTGVTILSQPDDIAVDSGNMAFFTAGISGTASFQWQTRKSGTSAWSNVSGATDAVYSFTAALSQDGYEYRCSIKTLSGVVIYSLPASLTVKAPATIVISEQPTSVSTIEKGSAEFTVAASGASEMHYQWQYSKDFQKWTDISGATEATYEIGFVRSAMAGLYRCIVSNGAESDVITESATLSVYSSFSVLYSPSNTTTGNAVDTNFYVVVAAPYGKDITYEWFMNGISLGAETTKLQYNMLTISGSAINAYNKQSLTCEITCDGSKLTTSPAKIIITDAPVFVQQPVCVYGIEGGEAKLSAMVVGQESLFGGWRFASIDDTKRIKTTDANNAVFENLWKELSDDDNHEGVLTNVLTVKNLAAKEEYKNYYTLFIRNAIGDTYSKVAYITVTDAMTITAHPKSVMTGAYGAVSFTAASDADQYLATQWQVSYDNGTTWYDIPDATSSKLSIAEATADMDGYLYRAKFSRKVYGSDGALNCEWDVNYTTAASLDVLAYPYIYKQPESSSVIEGTRVNFSVGVSGGRLSYQWQVSDNGGITWSNVEGAKSSSYGVDSVYTGKGYKYRCLVVGPDNSVLSNIASLNIGAGVKITTQPVSVDIASGETATYTVAATCLQPITYQWQVSVDSGVTWSKASGTGATTPSFSVKADMTLKNAYFKCDIYNGTLLGAESDKAILRISEKANVVEEPENVSTSVGASASFSLLASGENISYQWQSSSDNGANWSDIAGATLATYTVASAKEAMNGTLFRCRVYNSFSEVFSTSVKLTVFGAVSVDPLPNSVAGYEGEVVTLAANSSNATSYQWQRFDFTVGKWVDVKGATSATYKLTLGMSDYNVSYRCIVSNGGSSVNSSPVRITVYAKVAISSISSVSAKVGSSASIYVVATGEAPLAYAWQVKKAGETVWTDLPDASQSTLFLNSLTFDMNGNTYRCTVSNPGSSASTQTTITVSWPPSVISDVSAQSVYAGDTATLNFNVEGASPLTYKWYEVSTGGTYVQVSDTTDADGTKYSGSATGTLKISNVSINKNGKRYYCAVSNKYGNSMSSTVRLEVKVAVAGASLVTAGSPLKLALASTSSEAAYQWQVMESSANVSNLRGAAASWSDISGATMDTLTIPSVSYNMRGNSYRCVISSGEAETIESDVVNLSVGQTYSQWALLNGVAGLPTDKLKGTSTSNIENYVFGEFASNPLKISTGAGELRGSALSTVSFKVQKLVAGVNVKVQYSTNLVDWIYTEAPIMTGSNEDYDIFETAVPAGERIFVRFELVAE